MIDRIHRRHFIAAAGAAAVLPAWMREAVAQQFTNAPLTIRNTDHAAYAKPGPFPFPEKPISIALPERGLSLVVFVSKEATEPKLIVFSHGALAEPMVYRYLLNHWASHGYMVVAPVHDDSVIAEGLRIRVTDAKGGAVWDLSGLLNDFSMWEQRARTCGRVIDAADDLARAFKRRIVIDRPVIAGHSYGAFTAQLLVGASVQTTEGTKQFLDDRWAAALLMSPQGAGIMGLSAGSWSNVEKPLMAMIGGHDVDTSGQNAQSKSDIFFRSRPNYKHLAFMPMADHNIYSGQRARPASYEERLFYDIKSATVAFFRAYVEYDAKAYGNITSDYFDRFTVEQADPRTGIAKHSRLQMNSR